jgi:hypothetical protein
MPSSSCARKRQGQDHILSHDKICACRLSGRTRSRHGRRFGSQAPGPAHNIENGRNLLQVAQGLRTAWKRQAMPGSSHGSKVSARGAATQLLLHVEYIYFIIHHFHFSIAPQASSCVPDSTMLFAGALCIKMPSVPSICH